MCIRDRSILGYNDEEDAINIANETIYGLSGYVSSKNIDNAKEVASKLRTGMVHINNAPGDQAAPFGGYKMSGNGREWGEYGLEDFLEIKSVMGAIPKSALFGIAPITDFISKKSSSPYSPHSLPLPDIL